LGQVCEKFSAERFFRSACEGVVPEQLEKLFEILQSQAGRDIFCIANGIGALEPLSFTRPAAGELVQVYDKMITLPPATIIPATAQTATTPPQLQKIVPSLGLLIHICAPSSQALVIKHLRGRAEDLTAAEFGSLLMKRMAVVGFGEGFCPAGEPGAGEEDGTFSNIEHVILPAKAGFDVYAKNVNPYSPATFSIHGEMWETC